MGRSIHVIILLVSLLVSFPLHANAAVIKPYQQKAMLSAKSAYGSFNGFSTWKSGADCSTWQRVQCNSAGDVTHLHLANAMIRSTGVGIAPSLSVLTKLAFLSLYNNSITAELGTVLSTLTSLKTLNLQLNRFYGSSSSRIWKLTQLTYLDISHNLLVGPLGAGLGALTNLAYLDVSSNYFRGAIPASFSNLVKLKYSDFSSCFFTELPPSFPELDPGNLTFAAESNLIMSIPITFPASAAGVFSIDLWGNLLAELPTEVALLTELKVLNVAANRIATPLEDIAWSELVALEELYLGRNAITGTVPTDLAALTTLRHLHFHTNLLTGSLPDELTLLTDLVSLDIGLNTALGEGQDFPVGFSELQSLTRLVIIADNFAGLLPQPYLGADPGFYLDARNNSFTGSPLVKDVCPNSRPNRLRVAWNCLDDPADCSTNQRVLSGSSPAFAQTIKPPQESALLSLKTAFGYFTGSSTWGAGKPCANWLRVTCSSAGDVLRLNFTSASMRWKTAGIPIALTNLTNLDTLILANNEIVAPIPWYLSKLPKLKRLDLSNNTFYGGTNQIWTLTKLTFLDVSKTLLRGALPPAISGLVNLVALNVSDSYFSGPIPDAFSSLTKLQFGHLDRCFFTALPAALPELADGALTFTASGNLFSDIPATFPASSATVDTLDLSSNLITSLPTEISLMSDLRQLNLANNQLSIALADVTWSGLPSLEALNLGFNEITGSIPAEVSDLSNLKSLQLQNNTLSDAVPDEIGSLVNLTALDLSNNGLTGDLPDSLNALSFLLRLVLANNQLTGPLPQPYLGASSKFFLDARNNLFTGSPRVKGICPNARPSKLLVSGNCLSDEPGCTTVQNTCDA
ncbi:unnamed protein product [Closterium sp. Naga37s-1]|nr:unnamed protein product [Closterium sp. Naga37s-1]